MMEKIRFKEFVSELKRGIDNCIIVKDRDVMRFSQPGVKSLLSILGEAPGKLNGSSVFDTIVGKGAAALMILGGVEEVYAELISDHAIGLLERFEVNYSYGKRVPYIENKAKNGLCPIESLATTSDNPQEIYRKILDFVSNANKPA